MDMVLAYDTGLFSAAGIDSIVAGLWATLEGFGADLDRPLAMLSGAGRRAVPAELV
jgi:hypothetical protein